VDKIQKQMLTRDAMQQGTIPFLSLKKKIIVKQKPRIIREGKIVRRNKVSPPERTQNELLREKGKGLGFI